MENTQTDWTKETPVNLPHKHEMSREKIYSPVYDSKELLN